MSALGPTRVFWNPGAGSAAAWGDVHARLQNTPGVRMLEPDGRESALAAIHEACRENAELVVAAGGDGTVSTAVEGVMRSECRPAIGILPLGTGNDFARSLGIPLDPDEALRTLTAGTRRAIDVLQIESSSGTRWIANMLTGGNTGRFLGEMTDELKKQWGPLCYLRGVIDVALDLETYRITITCDSAPPETYDALNVFVANGRTSGGGLTVSPRAEIDDGFLDVIVVREGTATEIAGLTTQYLVADHLDHELIEFRRAQRLRIESEPPLPLTADGEVIGTTPVEVRIEHHGLQVIVPADDPHGGPSAGW